MKPSPSRSVPVWVFIFLPLLLILPIWALLRQGVDARWIIGVGLVVNLVTFGVYAHDKRQAQIQAWRIPENSLHLLEFIGGWPGALLAQQWLRHKCAKLGYQCFFWLIVLIYQVAALDFFRNWQFSRAALKYISTLSR